MKKSMILAMTSEGVIGNGNKLPWHLPEDLKYFKKVTANKPMIMGNSTFKSLPGVLPDRLHIVMTSDTTTTSKDPRVVYAFSKRHALAIAENTDTDEVMIIGGGKIYKQFENMVDQIYVTEILPKKDGSIFEGNVYAPTFATNIWEPSKESGNLFGENGIPYKQYVLTRRQANEFPKLQTIAKSFDVILHDVTPESKWVEANGLDAYTDCSMCAGREIWLGIYENPELRILSFFHELGHITNYGNETPCVYATELSAWESAYSLADMYGYKFSINAKMWATFQLATYAKPHNMCDTSLEFLKDQS